MIPLVKLKHYITQVRGIAYKPDEIADAPFENSAPLLKANNITVDGLDKSSLIYIAASRIKPQQFILAGDLLLAASSGSKKAIGKSAHFSESFSGSFGAFCKVVRPKNGLNSDYLKHFFKTSYYRSSIEKAVQGANINNLRNENLDDLEIPLPALEEQIRIAHLLDKVEGLIAKRKRHLQQLDDLLKSVFLEMFGDIRAKKSVHPWAALRPYLNANSGKSSKSVLSEIDTGIPIYGGNGINGWAKEALYEDPVVVAGRVGQQCGVIHVSKGPCWVTDNAIVLSISDHSLLNTVYLARAFHYAPIRERVKQLDLPFINQSMLLDYPLPLPPIDLQNKFSAIVELVEGIKSRYQRSLADLEALYGALSQYAFKGELNLSRVPVLGIESVDEKTVAVEPLLAPIEQNLAIHLPDTDNWLDVLDSTEARKNLLTQWLEAYCGQLVSAPFSVQNFIAAAETRLAELHRDYDFALGANDYEHIKSWVFDQIRARKLKQTRNIVIVNDKRQFGNRIFLRVRKSPEQ